MTIWGLGLFSVYSHESKKQVTHCFDKAKGKLHISQATIAGGTGYKGLVVSVWCKVQHSESPILLFSISPYGNRKSIPLNFEFGEDDGDVSFWATGGPNFTVHLAGYFIGNPSHNVPTADLLL